MPCTHLIECGTVSEADGGHDIEDGSTIVDVNCSLCGKSGSVRIMPVEINWDDDEE